jgi:ferredoxin-NADP reductase
MSTFEARLEGRREVAAGTCAFHFSKPSSFIFEAGQAIDLILGDPASTDAQSARHTFSIVSAPTERELTIATRMRESGFKRALAALPVGSTAKLNGPFGSFASHDDRERPLVLVAGGIVITPFMSILRQAAHEASRRPISLIYSNRRPEDAAFLDELEELARRSGEFRLLATMTQMNRSARPWQGETARINETLLNKAAGHLQAPMHYLAGPSEMVKSMRQTLTLAGIAKEHVRSEEFFGY